MPKSLATSHAQNWRNSQTPIFMSGTSTPRSHGWDCDRPFPGSAHLAGRELPVSLRGDMEFSRQQAAYLLTSLAAPAARRCATGRCHAGLERPCLACIPGLFESAGTAGTSLRNPAHLDNRRQNRPDLSPGGNLALRLEPAGTDRAGGVREYCGSRRLSAFTCCLAAHEYHVFALCRDCLHPYGTGGRECRKATARVPSQPLIRPRLY